jgi:hypothetical protein
MKNKEEAQVPVVGNTSSTIADRAACELTLFFLRATKAITL